ncbi:exported hypothetical protein [uncultured Paludibacter sp.]|uniref:Uncharacterized protein n=1 Tax=uncultured Paludibacter sp. TaxID=497635 RepID=A0A653AKP6_9BACT|nr:exported hypothetical protein [uncultured Paludibacter sp.]
MRFLKFIPIFCVLFAHSTLASDTIKIVNPVYSSSLEKSLFNDFIQRKTTDVLQISLSMDSTVTQQKAEEYKNEVIRFLSENKDKFQNAANEKSRIKEISKTSSRKFLKQYEDEVYTIDVFETGKYNLITAWIYYGYILEKLGIPFTITEELGHIYLTAYPASAAVPLELNKVELILIQPDQQLKNLFVNFLLDSKLVSKAELSSKGAEGVFNEYYYAQKNITLLELVGYQYFNNAIDFINKQDIKSAAHQLEKSYLLYPSYRTLYLLEQSLISIVQEDKFADISNLIYFSKLASYTKTNSIKEFVIGKFLLMTEDYLITSNRVDLYDRIFNRLDDDVSDVEMKKQIADLYYLNKAKFLAVHKEINKSWDVICKGYKNNSENTETINLMQQVFMEQMRPQLGSDDFKYLYFRRLEEYPILAKSNNILSMGGYYFLHKIYNSYYTDDVTTGDQTMSDFEKFMKQYDYKPESFLIGMGYGEAASYYYRKHDLKKCKATLDRGLEISPNNNDLLRKYKINFPEAGK